MDLPAAETIKIVQPTLADLGVKRGQSIMLHSAFRTLSHAGVRAERFLDAVLDFLGDGTLALPAMSWRICTPENPVFDQRKTPSHVGVLSEIFRTAYATHRSLHPTHSVAALGPEALFLVADHHLDTTPCSARSPWGRLADLDAQILLVGVDMESCTMMHHFEERFAADLYLRPEVEVYPCYRTDGTSVDVAFRRHRKLPRDFLKFRSLMDQAGRVRYANLAGTRIIGFAARDLAKVAVPAFQKNAGASLDFVPEP